MPTDHATPRPDTGHRSASAPVQARGALSPLVIFRVGMRLYGLPAGLVVRECMPVPDLLPLAVEMPHITGCLKLGGTMVGVLDMGVLLGARAQAVRQPVDLLYRPLLLCNLPGGGSVGLVVDAALDVVRPEGGMRTVVDGAPGGAEGARQELELGDGSIAFMLRMTDILNDGEQVRLDSLMARARMRAALWAGGDDTADADADAGGDGA
ncbi:chemotaxis protein CheW [Komagataeibacter sp. FNDCF1]|uniref:chemotaxis protein CheW n=1 Tax=Komagataeibacter sp. FNDCF1 TaxID=2878681 RepID=UPI001E37D03D|nr:chemotaxis protein CheW [Komagataeibacter sp. FNDCF1]MCE2564309.1 chemotaxis protein CheW [Komagataeibacter sp. FNDCF1]